MPPLSTFRLSRFWVLGQTHGGLRAAGSASLHSFGVRGKQGVSIPVLFLRPRLGQGSNVFQTTTQQRFCQSAAYGLCSSIMVITSWNHRFASSGVSPTMIIVSPL